MLRNTLPPLASNDLLCANVLARPAFWSVKVFTRKPCWESKEQPENQTFSKRLHEPPNKQVLAEATHAQVMFPDIPEAVADERNQSDKANRPKNATEQANPTTAAI
jgi:hypothetical protein